MGKEVLLLVFLASALVPSDGFSAGMPAIRTHALLGGRTYNANGANHRKPLVVMQSKWDFGRFAKTFTT